MLWLVSEVTLMSALTKKNKHSVDGLVKATRIRSNASF